jgi:CubicO group peptidase (beta-lactamase class C family)
MHSAAVIAMCGCLVCALIPAGTGRAQSGDDGSAELWRFDRLDRIGGHPTTVLGAPRVVETSVGRAVEFDGHGDALLVDVHPLAAAKTFTWEAIFRPDGGHREQRWFHLQETGSDNRMLFEIRVVGDRWFLDSFNFSTTGTATLMNKGSLHPLGAWYHVAAVYDGQVFSNYVNGVRQAAAEVRLSPQGLGRSSIGVRINLVDRFRGAIHSARFTRRALSPTEFLQAPPAASGSFPPPDGQGGWRAVNRADDVRHVAGIDRAKLDDTFEYIKGSSKNGGLLVVRHGWLVYERYFGLGHREATPNLASCGKSVTSIAVGHLLGSRPELFPQGLEQKVFTPDYLPSDAFPLTDPRKADIKLGQLLAMTACVRGNNPVYVRGTPARIDPAGPDGWQAGLDAVALGRKDAVDGTTRTTTSTLWCEPGGGYSYATSSIHLAGMVLQHVTGQDLHEYVDEHLARPLGWRRWGFGYRGPGRLERMTGGGGIALRATDMLRFGYLLLHEGRWGDRQLVPADYVRHASRRSPYNPHYPYSLQFTVNTGGEIPELPRDAFWKLGSGGHALYVVPSLDLVVWKLGGRDDQYSPANTRMEPHPDAPRTSAGRENWKLTLDPDTAARRTLELIVAAVME